MMTRFVLNTVSYAKIYYLSEILHCREEFLSHVMSLMLSISKAKSEFHDYHKEICILIR